MSPRGDQKAIRVKAIAPGSPDTVGEQAVTARAGLAVNGGPHFKFTDGVSLMVNCETQAEIDGLGEKLSRGGKKIACGWLRDKFSVSWQIESTVAAEMITDPDPKKSQRVVNAILGMTKLDIETLKRAYAGKEPTARRARRER